MTDAEYERAIAANARRADISHAQCDDISEGYWRDEVIRLSDQREAARARTLSDAMTARLNASIGRLDARDHCDTFDVLKGSPDHSIVRNA